MGISAGTFEASQPPGTFRELPGEDLATRARSFVTAIQSRWSDANVTGLAWLDALYAYEVDYYGKRLSREEVLAEKRHFAERWPERAYKVQTNSMKAQCGALECIVTGNIEWEARSLARNATSSGIASFTYVLAPSGGTFLIREENGSVMQVRTSGGEDLATRARSFVTAMLQSRWSAPTRRIGLA